MNIFLKKKERQKKQQSPFNDLQKNYYFFKNQKNELITHPLHLQVAYLAH